MVVESKREVKIVKTDNGCPPNELHENGLSQLMMNSLNHRRGELGFYYYFIPRKTSRFSYELPQVQLNLAIEGQFGYYIKETYILKVLLRDQVYDQ